MIDWGFAEVTDGFIAISLHFQETVIGTLGLVAP